MKIQKFFFPFLFVIISLVANSQKIKKADQVILTNLQKHIQYLADDKLEGRRTGTQGELLAMNYIADQFKLIGLQAKGIEGYFQPFDIYEGKQINPATQLI